MSKGGGRLESHWLWSSCAGWTGGPHIGLTMKVGELSLLMMPVQRVRMPYAGQIKLLPQLRGGYERGKRTMTVLERRALLGDAKAQRECTEKGIVLPCPFCGGPATAKS